MKKSIGLIFRPNLSPEISVLDNDRIREIVEGEPKSIRLDDNAVLICSDEYAVNAYDDNGRIIDGQFVEWTFIIMGIKKINGDVCVMRDLTTDDIDFWQNRVENPIDVLDVNDPVYIVKAERIA